MLVSRLGDEAGAVDVSPAAGMSAGHEEPPSTGNTRARVGGREERAYSKPSGKLVTSMISCARCARKTTSRLNRGDELRAAAAQRIPKTSTAFSMGNWETVQHRKIPPDSDAGVERPNRIVASMLCIVSIMAADLRPHACWEGVQRRDRRNQHRSRAQSAPSNVTEALWRIVQLHRAACVAVAGQAQTSRGRAAGLPNAHLLALWYGF